MEDAPLSPFNRELFKELLVAKMPFGKYKGWLIKNLPEHYLVWYNRKGIPKGKLGDLLSTMLEIRINGLEYLLKGEMK
jgi:hypothetical protein